MVSLRSQSLNEQCLAPRETSVDIVGCTVCWGTAGSAWLALFSPHSHEAGNDVVSLPMFRCTHWGLESLRIFSTTIQLVNAYNGMSPVFFFQSTQILSIQNLLEVFSCFLPFTPQLREPCFVSVFTDRFSLFLDFIKRESCSECLFLSLAFSA